MGRLKTFALIGASSIAALQVARTVIRARRNLSWAGKRVVITGGSRGLGLVLARKLAQQGARLAICSRTQSQLDIAASELRSIGAEVFAHICDVKSDEEVQTFMTTVADQFGGIDVVFNVAGVIIVGPIDAMTMKDFENSMQTNCWGALRTTLAALPYMRKQGWGRIVNIASLGGKRAIPHMVPYAASKFAMVGLSNGLRAELQRENIHVTTACPALMITGSPRNATFKGKHRAEYAWFSVGDSLPPFAMSAERAADQILAACQAGRGEVLIHNPLNIIVYFQQFLPELTREILAATNRVLPRMGGIGRKAAKGYQSESAWSPSFLTTLSQRAAVKNNEL